MQLCKLDGNQLLPCFDRAGTKDKLLELVAAYRLVAVGGLVTMFCLEIITSCKRPDRQRVIRYLGLGHPTGRFKSRGIHIVFSRPLLENWSY